MSRNPSSSVRFAPDTAVKWVSLRKRQVIKQSPEESGPVSARTPSRARDHHCTERDPKMKRIQLAAGNISKTDSLTIELIEASDPCRDHDHQAGPAIRRGANQDSRPPSTHTPLRRDGSRCQGAEHSPMNSLILGPYTSSACSSPLPLARLGLLEPSPMVLSARNVN